jgi:hypothetical protein
MSFCLDLETIAALQKLREHPELASINLPPRPVRLSAETARKLRRRRVKSKRKTRAWMKHLSKPAAGNF